jgi:hypothetical protein
VSAAGFNLSSSAYLLSRGRLGEAALQPRDIVLSGREGLPEPRVLCQKVALALGEGVPFGNGARQIAGKASALPEKGRANLQTGANDAIDQISEFDRVGR